MTSYQQSLKPGDEVDVRGHGVRLVVFVTPLGVAHTYGYTDAPIRWAEWEAINEPPAPKAEPGVRYRRPITSTLHAEAVGLRDGRLWTAHETKDFDPNVWTKVD